MRSLHSSFYALTAALFLSPAGVFAQQGLSHVRVVRLSYVSGTVTVTRPGSTEPRAAIVNTPIQEGFELATSASSYAEVEFENGSSMRLGQFSRAGFTQLAMDGEGNKLNRLKVEQGYASFHIMPEHHDVYSVTLADATLNPSGKSEFRTDFDGGQARVEVMNGSVQVAAGPKSARLGKDEFMQFTPVAGEMAFNIQHGITKDGWDKWSEARNRQQQSALRDQAISAPGSAAYGWSDLDFYGEWAMFPGFGYGWSPYVAAGWCPFSMGMWDNYPGLGLTWISSEPWGWLPYHYGMWNFDPMMGWFWMPGGFNYWSPALVNWYSGPGWTGWAPRGVYNPRATNAITSVAGNAVRTGQILSVENVQRQSLTAGTMLKAQPAFEAGVRPPLSAMRPTARSVRGTTQPFQNHAAPATILMGGNPVAEKALLDKHPGALARAFGASNGETLRVRQGTTLGGMYAVRGSAGEFRGDIFHAPGGGPAMQGMRGPAMSSAPRGGNSRATVLAHGQASAPSGGSGGMRSSGGGFSHGGPSSPSAGSSVSSSGHSASSSGGGSHR